MTAPYDVQICTITGESDPNFFSIYDEELRPKKLYLLVTERMTGKAGWFTEAVSGLVPKVNIIHKAVDDADDPFCIERTYEEIFEETRKNNERVLVNITGGTKLFAISASTICEKNGIDYIYFPMGKTSFLCFSPSERNANSRLEKIPQHKVIAKVDAEWLERYFKAHGIGINKGNGEYLHLWAKPTSEQNKLIQELLNNSSFRKALKIISGLPGMEKEPLVKCFELPPKTEEKDKKAVDQLLNKLINLRMIEIRSDKGIKFRDHDTFNFCCLDRWFEQYVADILMQIGIRPFTMKFHEYPRRRKENAEPIINELDVVFFNEKKLRLHVIEAKSGSSAVTGKEAQKYLHQIKVVTEEVGGRGAKAAMACLTKTKANYIQRAENYELGVFSGSDVKDREKFKQLLKRWFDSK